MKNKNETRGKNSRNKSEMIENTVLRYFAEKEIKDLMQYGSDRDEGLYKLSDLYDDLLTELDIKHLGIYTEDISDGKYETVVEISNNEKLNIYTNAWNGSEIVSDNIMFIHTESERLTSKEQNIKFENIRQSSSEELEID